MNVLSLFLATLLSSSNVCNENIDTIDEKDSLVEIVSERTENSKVFKMENGNHKVRIYDRNIHYELENKYYEFDYNFYENDDKFYSNKGKYNSSIDKETNKVIVSYEQTNSLELLLDNNSCKYNELTRTDKIVKNDEVAFYEDESAFYFSSIINSNSDIDNTKYSIKSDLLEIEGYSFYNDSDDEIYNLTNHYLISSNNIQIHPTSLEITNIGNSTYEVSPNYDLSILDNKEIEYPLVSVSSITYSQNNSSEGFNDKYVINQTPSTYDTSMMLVGKDNIQTINNAGMLINTEYVGILEIERPKIGTTLVPSEDILSVDLVLNRNTSSNITCPVIDLYRITNNNLSFSSIDGTTSLSKTFLKTKQAGLSEYSYDITNALKNSTNSLLLALYGSSSSTRAYASFYSSHSTSNASYIEIEYQIHYGDAESFNTDDNIGDTGNQMYVTCVEYAFNKGIVDDQIIVSSENTHNVEQRLIKVLETLNINDYRIIDGYDAYILPSERRIAYSDSLITLDSGIYYHFIKQHSDGSWSGINGSSVTIAGISHYSGINPAQSDLFTNYDSGIVYIAYR